MTSARPSDPTLWRCSWSGYEPKGSALSWTKPLVRASFLSAGGWTGCRWRSSSRRRACGRSRSPIFEQRLDHRFRLLTGGSRSALPRQRTLLATVQWSYSLLGSTEQALLRRLSVFVDGFDLEAVEAVCVLDDLDSYEVADLLASLVDKSLVLAEPSGQAVRYQLLETIRQFAGERLIDDPDEAAVLGQAHLAHFVALAERAAGH